MFGIGTPLRKNLIELFSGPIGWSAGLQITILVQSNGSHTLQVLNKVYKMIYLMYKSVKFWIV